MNRKISDTELKTIFGINTPAVTGLARRWFEVDEIISFTSCCPSYNNAEFQINNDPKWTIWFSQLNTPLYNGEFKGELDGLQFCSIQLKAGFQFPCRLSPSEFWHIVKGKRFKVVGALPCYRPNEENNEVRRMGPPIDVYEKVHKAIINGNGNTVKDMLKPARCYDLIEI